MFYIYTLEVLNKYLFQSHFLELIWLGSFNYYLNSHINTDFF